MKLPAIISDGMILSQNCKIWGYSEAGSPVHISFINNSYVCYTGDNGYWELGLTDLPLGGPYEMQIGDITVKDIMVGYVWLCSGQSNMEIPISRIRIKYESELQNIPDIRAFTVRKDYDFIKPQEELYEGSWAEATEENIDSFSAVGYFFAKKIHNELNAPVGLICCAAGGSSIESWISPDILSVYPDTLDELKKLQQPGYVKSVEENDNARVTNWHDELNKNDVGLIRDYPNIKNAQWSSRDLISPWDKDIKNFCGCIWFRKEVVIPEKMANKECRIFLGRITDSDHTYINGCLIGETAYQYPPRIYDIPKGLLKPGKNTITVRVISEKGNGSFTEGKEYKIACKEGVESESINIDGDWEYTIGCKMEPLEPSVFFYEKSSGLHNAMFKPVSKYSVNGVLWYQGETNANRPDNYSELFGMLVNNWRESLGNIPFLYVQLPNFETEENWAGLRQQQLKCLNVENTAMVVAIDCGEYNDLHPLNKKAVGERLGLAALEVIFNKDSGGLCPVLESALYENSKIILTFMHIKGSLLKKNAEDPLIFEVSEDGNTFEEVKGTIEDNKVIINYKNEDAALVRYAWKNNPKVSLYNGMGLPASPFVVNLKECFI